MSSHFTKVSCEQTSAIVNVLAGFATTTWNNPRQLEKPCITKGQYLSIFRVDFLRFSCNKVMMVELLRPKQKSFIFLNSLWSYRFRFSRIWLATMRTEKVHKNQIPNTDFIVNEYLDLLKVVGKNKKNIPKWWSNGDLPRVTNKRSPKNKSKFLGFKTLNKGYCHQCTQAQLPQNLWRLPLLASSCGGSCLTSMQMFECFFQGNHGRFFHHHQKIASAPNHSHQVAFPWGPTFCQVVCTPSSLSMLPHLVPHILMELGLPPPAATYDSRWIIVTSFVKLTYSFCRCETWCPFNDSDELTGKRGEPKFYCGDYTLGMLVASTITSWWFQPSWKISIKLDHFAR